MAPLPGEFVDREFVEDLCARDTLAARTRMLLLRLEKQGHRLGWDNPDGEAVFRLDYHPQSGQVAHCWSDAYTEIVQSLTARYSGNVGRAFQTLAGIVEDLVDGKFDDEDVPPEIRSAFPRKVDGSDLWAGKRPGWKFYGYGYRHEAWMVKGKADELEDPLTRRLRREHRLDEHPDRLEIRQVSFTARDGLAWFVSRTRGEQPTVAAYRPEGDVDMGGNVVNALSRLTNVVAGNPVPVRSRGVPPALRRRRGDHEFR